MTGKVVLPEQDLLEKAAAIKRFEYSLLGKELEKQNIVAENQYQKFDNSLEFDNAIKKPPQNMKNTIE